MKRPAIAKLAPTYQERIAANANRKISDEERKILFGVDKVLLFQLFKFYFILLF